MCFDVLAAIIKPPGTFLCTYADRRGLLKPE